MKRLMLSNFRIVAGLFLLILAGSGCSKISDYASVGNQILSASGYGASSGSGEVNYDSLLAAGNKLAQASRGLSEEQEYYLGRGVAAVILSKYKLYQNPSVVRYVNQVGSGLAMFSDRPELFNGYRFAILDTPEVNAVSTPGGFVFISRGFLKSMKSEDELASVLAHEIGHIVNGHGTAAISRANITDALTTSGKEVAESEGGQVTMLVTRAFGDSIKDVTETLLTNGYSRSQEYEADEYAALLLGRSGYDSQGLNAMLNQLNTLEASNPAGGWFSTHPSASRRLSNIKEELTAPDASVQAAEKIRTARFKQFLRGLA